jgi:predicted NBD/HSP70 family sugar kinase
LPNGDHLAIASLIRDRGAISRAEIARVLDMSPSTVGRLVDWMIETGLLRETGQRVGSSAGRPGILLEFNGEISSVLTVDLRLTEAYAVITDLCGNPLIKCFCSLTIGDTKRSVDELIAIINDLIQASTRLPPLNAIIIGAPSIVNVETGVIEWAPSLGWSNLVLKELLEQKFKISVQIENDVNLAALGEYWKGTGRAVKKNMVFVSIGTGIGAGIIIDGSLYRGTSFAAGEVAYFITDAAVLRENAWLVGNLESRVGREGLIQMAQLVAQRYPSSRLTGYFNNPAGPVDTGVILKLAEEGDQAATVVFNELVDILTIVICNIAVVLDPEMIVLGGPSDWDWTVLTAAIRSRVGSALLRPIDLRPSQLGHDALIIGGAYTALSLHMFDE